MYSRDYPYNDYPYNDYPYLDFPYVLDNYKRPASHPKAPANPVGRSRSLRPLAFCLLLFLRTSPFWTLSLLLTRRLLPGSFIDLTVLSCFALLTIIARLLFRHLINRYTALKKTGSNTWVPLYLITVFWACILPALVWFEPTRSALHFTSRPSLYALLIFLAQALLVFRSYHLHFRPGQFHQTVVNRS
jgi:hypothetical protein